MEKMDDIESASPRHLKKKKLLFTPDTIENGESEVREAQTPVSRTQKQQNKKSYEKMICETILENDANRKGVSCQMIQKIIKGKYMIEGEIKLYVKRAYEKLLLKETIEHVTGSGAQGSIRFTKTYWEQMKRAEKKSAKKIDQKRAPKVTKAKTEKSKPAKDMNNNRKKAKEEVKLKVKVQPKKTALTRTKLDKTSTKVRLSITTGAQPKPEIAGKGKTMRKLQPKVTSTPMTKAQPKPKLAKEAKKSGKKVEPKQR